MGTNRQWAALLLVPLAALLLVATALPAAAAGPQTGAALPAPFTTPEPTKTPPSGDTFVDMIKLFGYNIGLFLQNLGTFVTNPQSTPVPAIQPPYCCTKTPEATKTPKATATSVPPTSAPPTSVPATETPTAGPTAVLAVSAVPTAVLGEAFLPVTGGDPVGAKLMSLLPVVALALLALPGLRTIRRRP